MTTKTNGQEPDKARPSRRPAPPGLLDVDDHEWEPWDGPPPRDGRMSRLAIASFVLGLLGGLLAPIFGIAALLQIRRSGERGRPFAVAGLVLSGIWTLVLVLVFTVVAPRWDPDAGVHGLREGECFNTPGAGPEPTTAPRKVTKVPCDQPHEAELIGDLPPYDRYTDERYPGRAALDQWAEAACRRQFRVQVLDPLTVPAHVSLRWYVPTRAEWGRLARITCYLTGGDIPLTRSLRLDVLAVNSAQLSYLLAERNATEAEAALRAAGLEVPVTELQELAEQAGSAHTRLWLRLLEEPGWDATQPAGKRLLVTMRKSSELWDQARKATDRAALLDLAAQAGRHRDREAELAVRRALGLSTVQGEPAR